MIDICICSDNNFFHRNCWLLNRCKLQSRTCLYTIKKKIFHKEKKISLDEKKISLDEKKIFELSPVEKNYSFKWNKLIFEDDVPFIFHDSMLNLVREQIFDLWENNFDIEKNIHINEHLQIHYNHEQKCLPFLLTIENINSVVEHGRDLNRVIYFKPTSLIQSGLIYELFAEFKDKIHDFLKIRPNELLDSGGLIRLNCTQKIPRNRVVYFRNLIVCFERIEKVIHRRKEKYCFIT